MGCTAAPSAYNNTVISPLTCILFCFVVTVFAAQERLRWKWPQDQTSIKNIPPPSSGVGVKGDTNVAQELLNFLDTHLLAHEPGRLDVTADSSSRVLADQYPRGYSVEVHHPALGGKLLLCCPSLYQRRVWSVEYTGESLCVLDYVPYLRLGRNLDENADVVCFLSIVSTSALHRNSFARIESVALHCPKKERVLEYTHPVLSNRDNRSSIPL